MFTGIVEEVGTVASLQRLGDSAVLTVRGPLVVSDAVHGGSIAVNGVCLTVTGVEADTFTVDVMAETLQRSSLGALHPGDPVNLERALAVGDRLGGHIVQGHVDGTARIAAIQPEERWTLVRVHLPEQLRRYVAAKGSIGIDGVSLTVVEAGRDSFSVSLIPATLAGTTLGRLRVGQSVNLEVDVLAKYVQRRLEAAQ